MQEIKYKCFPKEPDVNNPYVGGRLKCSDCILWVNLFDWENHGKCIVKNVNGITSGHQLCNECRIAKDLNTKSNYAIDGVLT